MRIITVLGARPQFIKAAPVGRALAAAGVEESIIHTGQHYDEAMSGVFFSELGIAGPRWNLACGGGTQGAMTGAMLAGVEHVLMAEKPDAVMVYGDTNSTLAGALAAAKLHIPVAHVEAGLRSFNRRMPEELNRICTDHLASLLFCSSEEGLRHLGTEGITRGVHLVGDVMADALIAALTAAQARPESLGRLTTEQERSEGFALMTVHRAENTDDPARLSGIFEGFRQWGGRAVFPIHARTRNVIARLGLTVPDNVRVIAPVGYFDLCTLLGGCRLVASDSGGLQKEAYWAGKPCVILRDETEWVEIVQSGWGVLAGADTTAVTRALHSPPSASLHPQLYGGDGGAAKRIALILQQISA